jgi:hypothetical protein
MSRSAKSKTGTIPVRMRAEIVFASRLPILLWVKLAISMPPPARLQLVVYGEIADAIFQARLHGTPAVEWATTICRSALPVGPPRTGALHRR